MDTIEKKARGLDRAELERISRLPDAQVPVDLYNHLCMHVMGRKAAPASVTYAYGVYDTLGNKITDPRVRRTQGVELPPGRTLRTEPEGQHIAKMAHTQQVRGSYTLYFDLQDKKPPVRIVLINGRPGERRWDADGQRYVDTLDEEAVNIEHGYLSVDTKNNHRLFCFLELHPANFGSPVRNLEDCQRLGFTVTADDIELSRRPSIRTDVMLAVKTAEIMDQARNLELLGKLQAADPATLRKTARACNFPGLIAGTDHDIQFRAFLKGVIESKAASEAIRNHQEIIRAALSGDEAYVEGLVTAAFDLGILATADGEYYFNGDHWADFICPISRAGEERDHLISLLSVPGKQDWINKLDTAVTAAKNEIHRADAIYEQHDREIEKAIAAEILFKDTQKTKKWCVKGVDGQVHELVSIAVGSKEKQLEELKKWARNQNIEKLKETLALLYAVE